MQRSMAVRLVVTGLMALGVIAFIVMKYGAALNRRPQRFTPNHHPRVEGRNSGNTQRPLVASTIHPTEIIASRKVTGILVSQKRPLSSDDMTRSERIRLLKGILIKKIMKYDPKPKRAAEILSDIASGNVNAIRQKLSAGLSPNSKLVFGAQTHEWETLLEAAITFHQTEIAKLLLDSGAGVGGGGWRNAPLVSASGEGEEKVVAALLEHGANPNQVNGMGHSALDQAVRGGHYSVVKMLVAQGADIHDALAGNGTIPWYVSQNKSPNYVAIKQFLIAHGAIRNGN